MSERRWTPIKKIKFAFLKLSLLNRIIICVILVGIFPFLNWIFSGLTKTKQLFDLKISKGLEYSIWMEPLIYKDGAINRGLEWKEYYREYLLRIKHVSKQFDVVNLLFEADMPTGIVKAEIESQEGCESRNKGDGSIFE